MTHLPWPTMAYHGPLPSSLSKHTTMLTTG